jgi:hypothetical protein
MLYVCSKVSYFTGTSSFSAMHLALSQSTLNDLNIRENLEQLNIQGWYRIVKDIVFPLDRRENLSASL